LSCPIRVTPGRPAQTLSQCSACRSRLLTMHDDAPLRLKSNREHTSLTSWNASCSTESLLEEFNEPRRLATVDVSSRRRHRCALLRLHRRLREDLRRKGR